MASFARIRRLASLALAASVLVTVHLAMACDGGASNPARSEATRETSRAEVGKADARTYAVAMADWWRLMGITPPSVAGDWDAEAWLKWEHGSANRPQPPKAPHALVWEHKALITALSGWAQSEAEVKFEATYAGIAAAFCDPRAEAGERFPWLLWHRVESLQLWRAYGEGCSDRARYAGRFLSGISKGDIRYYELSCGSGDLSEFGISVINFQRACEDRERWEDVLEAASQRWAEALVQACGVAGAGAVLVGPSNALAECGTK